MGKIEDYLPPLKKILFPIIGKKGVDVPAMEESEELFLFQHLLRKKTAPPVAPDTKPGDTALLQYTGGTTGTSKGAMLSHRNIVVNNAQMRHWYFVAREGQETFISVLPFFHSYGMAAAMSLPLSLGASPYPDTALCPERYPESNRAL